MLDSVAFVGAQQLSLIKMESLQKLAPILDKVTPLNLAIGLSGISLIIMFVSTCNAVSVDGPLPPPRKPPPSVETTTVLSDRYTKGFYRGQLDDDCKALGIRRVGLDTLKQPNPHTVEYTGGTRIKAGKKLETKSLIIRALTRRLLLGQVGRGIRTGHLALRITNKTDRFIAYRVVTSVSNSSAQQASLIHNAIALKPKQSIYRIESLTREASTVRINRVEVMELTRLGYHYCSRLDPLRLQYDKRIAASHRYKGLPTCRMLPWRMIKDGMRAQAVAWRDVIDFYSRHSCEEYTFFRGYRWSKKGVSELPVRPPDKE